GARGLDEEHRVVAGRTVGIDVVGERVGLDAGQPGAGERGRTVAGDMDVAGALAFDHGGVVVGDTQRDFYAEFLRQVSDERRPALGYAGSVFGRHDGEGQLRILALPVLRRSGGRERQHGGAGKNDATIDHDIPLV